MSPKNARVLLVEDDELTLEAARKALEKASHIIVFEASDKKTAFAKIDGLTEPPDVALLDGSFPVEPGGYLSEYAGEDVAFKLAQKFPDTIIVTFSAAKLKFSKHRFPQEGPKSEQVIERELGGFVTQLPPQARR